MSVDQQDAVLRGLAHAMRRIGPGQVEALARLSGGANMESWAFDYAGDGYVLRRAPSAEMMATRPLSHATEAALIRAARKAGVRAPEIVAELEPDDGLGTGFVMRRIEGEAEPKAILAAPPAQLLTEIAQQLAAIHRAPLQDFPALPLLDPAATVAEFKTRHAGYGGDRPVIALALRWLEQHLPTPATPSLVHGDLRMGNLMVAPSGLAGVLDWEQAHVGDAHDDLAYGCMTVWRFGAIDRPAFGLGALEDYFAAYEAAGGHAVDPARFRFWLVFRTVWWALGCLNMGELWRTHADRSLERPVIARRTCENELDLLLLLEEEAPAAERARPLPAAAPVAADRRGEPDAAELVAAVAEWLEADVKPRAAGRDRFLAAVALNALGIVRRELHRPAPAEDAALTADILTDRVTLATPGLLARLRRCMIDKVENDVPKYASLARAKQLWGA